MSTEPGAASVTMSWGLPGGASADIHAAININSAGTILPIELKDFSVEKGISEVKINWLTSFEINNDYFVVERSQDGRNFVGIAEIASKGALTNGEQRYQFIDENPEKGLNYYRLTQVDFDGTESTFFVEAIEINQPNVVVIFPNPVKNDLEIVFEESLEENGTLYIYDVTGKLLQTEVIAASIYKQSIDVTKLPNGGSYFIRVDAGNYTEQLTFIKE